MTAATSEPFDRNGEWDSNGTWWPNNHPPQNGQSTPQKKGSGCDIAAAALVALAIVIMFAVARFIIWIVSLFGVTV